MTLHTLALFGLVWFAFTSVAFVGIGMWVTIKLLEATTWLERRFLAVVLGTYGLLFVLSARTFLLCWSLA